MPKGVYSRTGVNPGFLGKKHTKETKEKMSNSLIGKKSWNEGKRFIQIEGEKNCNWEGDNVGYRALHNWVSNQKGKAKICEHCELDDPKRRYHWANIDHKYLRVLEDYISLCVPCHRKYDLINNQIG